MLHQGTQPNLLHLQAMSVSCCTGAAAAAAAAAHSLRLPLTDEMQETLATTCAADVAGVAAGVAGPVRTVVPSQAAAAVHSEQRWAVGNEKVGSHQLGMQTPLLAPGCVSVCLPALLPHAPPVDIRVSSSTMRRPDVFTRI